MRHAAQHGKMHVIGMHLSFGAVDRQLATKMPMLQTCSDMMARSQNAATATGSSLEPH